MSHDEIRRTVQREMRENPGGTTEERADRIAAAVKTTLDALRPAESHATSHHGPHVVLTLEAARHALRCLPDDDVSNAAVEIRSKTRRAVVSAPAFREPSA